MEASTTKRGRPRKDPNYVPPVKPEDRVVDVSDIPANRDESNELKIIIERANQLISEKQELSVKLHECRLLCQMMTNNGVGSRAQVEWIRKYLPRKKRNGKVESEDES